MTRQEVLEVDCQYRGGCPLLDATDMVALKVSPDGVQIAPHAGGEAERPAGLWVPTESITSVRYEEESLGMERAEYEEGVSIGDGEALIRHSVVIGFNDPEEVMPSGFRARFKFSNEYGARVFVKRASEVLGLPPF